MTNETLTLLSSIGLILSIIPVTLHGIEVLFPMLSRWISNWVLPFFGLKMPSQASALTESEQIEMFDAAIRATPKEKQTNVNDYLFLLLFEQRQGAIGFIAVAAGAIYGVTLGLAERNPLHLVFGIVAVLMMLVNANQAGWLPFGKHPRVSQHGKNVGIIFTPFWAVIAALNWLAFTYTII
ncbi:MAG: hypothetical protein AB8G95_24510 [Anaerolineae bacterium]